MGLADKVHTNKTAVGNLRAFTVLKDSELVKQPNTGNQLISNMWKARGGLPFRLPNNKTTTIVFLTDVTWIPVFDVAIGEKKGPKGRYPVIESFRSTDLIGISPDGEQIRSGRKCLFAKALGRGPKLVAVAKIVDLTPFKTKDGRDIPWAVRSIVIPSNSNVIQQLAATSEVSGKSVCYGAFSVSRSGSEKSVKIGDSWTYKEHFAATDIDEDMMIAANAIDFDAGYPILEDSEVVNVLRTHRRISDKFNDGSQQKNPILTYEEDGIVAVCGASTTAAPAAPTTAAPVNPAPKIGLGIKVLSDTKKTGLEDLDEIMVGNPLEGDDNDVTEDAE
jgi:hypothetical protein